MFMMRFILILSLVLVLKSFSKMTFNKLKVGTGLALTLICQSGISQVHFTNTAAEAGIDHFAVPQSNLGVVVSTGGAAWFDFDNDGWEDLYLTGGTLPDKLYRNNQDGTFADVSQQTGIYNGSSAVSTTGVSTADINRDGFVDILVNTINEQSNVVFINQGDGTFSDMASVIGITDMALASGISIADYDEDGWLDLYYTNWRTIGQSGWPEETGYPDRLYHNNGDGTFTDVTPGSVLWSEFGCGLASSFTDFDLDGDVDLILANDYGAQAWSDSNRLFMNDNGMFTDVSISMQFDNGFNAMGIAGADYDEDLDMDYYITDTGPNSLFRNDGNVFTDVAAIAGVQSQYNWSDTTGQMIVVPSWSWGTAFFDYDNDTYIDLFSSNGPLLGTLNSDENRLFKNNQASGTFDDVSAITGMNNRYRNSGCAVADYDKDGDLDMIVVGVDVVGSGNPSRTLLMKNEGGNINNWLEVSLSGTTSNPEAIGSILYLYVDGRTFIREVDSGGSSFYSHHSKVVHFGLGSYEYIDSLRVIWPQGNEQVLYQIGANQQVDVIESQGPVTVQMTEEIDCILYPNPVQDKLNFRLSESISNSQSGFNRFEIVDLLGNVIRQGEFKARAFSINLNKLGNGSYWLRIMLTNGVPINKSFVVIE